MKADFSIIGGGIAGLSTAIALKRIGIKAIVAEAAPEFKPVGAGIILAANALRAYQHLGIYELLTETGNSINEVQIKDQKGKVLSKTVIKESKNSLDNLAIHRADLHDILLSQLDADQILTGKKSKDITTDAEGYKIKFQDGFELFSKYVIVAEGINSLIRQKIIPKAKLRYSGYTCWRGILGNEKLKISEPTETWGSSGRFGMVPLGNDLLYWFACKNAEPNSSKMKSFSVNELYNAFKDYHQPIGSIIKNTPPENLIWNDIYDLKPISQYAFGNLVFIGDAAHATTPNLGQGACQAIEDAVVLANCIEKIPVIEEAFTAFQNKRIKRTHDIVKQSWQLGKIAQLENRYLSAIRNFIFKNLPASISKKQVEKLYNVSFD